MIDNYKKILKSELDVPEEVNTAVQGTFDKLGINSVKSKEKRPMLFIKCAAAILIACLIVPGGVVLAAHISGENSDFYQAIFGNSVRESVEEKVEYDEDGKMSLNLPNSERVDVDEEKAEELVGDYLIGELGKYELVGYLGEVTTLTIENLLYDTETGSYYIYMSLERENGDFSDITVFEDGECYFNGSGLVMGGRYTPGVTYYDSINSTDTKVYITAVGVSVWRDNEPMTLNFGEYVNSELAKSEDIGDEYIKEDGTLMERIYFELGEVYLPEVEASLPCSEIQVDGESAIIISSIGMRLYFEPLGIAFNGDNEIYYSAIEFTDGTRYVIEDDEGNVVNWDYSLIVGAEDNPGGNGSFRAYCFNRLVDLSDISKIIINDAEYTVQ